MEIKGRFHSLTKDYQTHNFIISFQVSPEIISQVDSIKDCDLRIQAKKWREKRSLDANGYAWVLMDKIASVLKTSKEEVYEEMLKCYGCLDLDENGEPIVITMKSSVPSTYLPGHWFPHKNNGMYCAYIKIKGSSEYDSKQMSTFIDGIVSEAKELGIETMTPAELLSLKGYEK